MKNTKKLKYSINSSVVILGAVIVTILLNAILVAFDSKIPLEVNLTRDEVFELTDETKEIVKKISEETKIILLYDSNTVSNKEMTLLTGIIEKYVQANDKIQMQTIDFVNNPMALTPYVEAVKTISSPYYSMIFAQGEEFETAEASTYITQEGKSNIERIITNKLATFADGFKISEITMVTGHGEKLNAGYESVMRMYNYTIKTVD